MKVHGMRESMRAAVNTMGVAAHPAQRKQPGRTVCGGVRSEGYLSSTNASDEQCGYAYSDKAD